MNNLLIQYKNKKIKIGELLGKALMTPNMSGAIKTH